MIRRVCTNKRITKKESKCEKNWVAFASDVPILLMGLASKKKKENVITFILLYSTTRTSLTS